MDEDSNLGPAPAPSPRVLTYATAVTCGVLVALYLWIGYRSRKAE